MSAADDLKRLAEAYPWVGLETPTEARKDSMAIRLIQLAAQLYTDNRALNERIVKLRGLVLCEYFTRVSGRCFANQGADREEWCDYCIVLAADDAAQCKG